MYGVAGNQHDFACVARKVARKVPCAQDPISRLNGRRKPFVNIMMHGPIVLDVKLDVTTGPRRTNLAPCQISGSNRLDAAFSKQSKDRSVRCCWEVSGWRFGMPYDWSN